MRRMTALATGRGGQFVVLRETALCGIYALAAFASGFRREDLSLVKAARQQSPAGERDGNQNIRIIQQLAPGFGQPSSKKTAGMMCIVEFERVNKLAHQAVEARDGTGAIEIRRVRRRSGRNHRATGIVGHRQPQPIAKRRPDEIDPSPTRRAKRIMRHDARPAAETKRRKQNVERRASGTSEGAKESRGAGLGRHAIFPRAI